MKTEQIKVGKTYKNKGAGRTLRTVLDMGAHLEAPWFSTSKKPDEPVVKFLQAGHRDGFLYLRSFAAWAGAEVNPNGSPIK